MFEDKSLSCCDCGKQFNFSAGEQEFFAAKNLKNEPRRCPDCRLMLRTMRNGQPVEGVTEATCANCGVSTRVPFVPKGYRPVLCTVCFQRNKREHEASNTSTEPLSLTDS